MAARSAGTKVKSQDATAAAPKVRGGIPNGLTLAGLGLGFLAALAAGKGDQGQALQMLALAAMADALAGRAAQGLGQSTPIGAELDSLASLIVWGLAVALLLYVQALEALGAWGTALAGLAAAAAAWRLCRGDSQNARERYEGLPLPAAGAMLAAAAALGAGAGVLVPLELALCVALLGPWTWPRIEAGVAWMAPVFLSLGLAAFGFRLGWALPGAAAAAYALLAPLRSRAGTLKI